MTAVDRPAGTHDSTGRGHVMVVGGTGMLSTVCTTLARRGHGVSALARRRRDLDGVRCYPCDYTDPVSFEAAMRAATEDLGPVEVLVTWIHGYAPDATEHARRLTRPRRHLRVLGSASARPPSTGSDDGAESVVLGFVTSGGRSRWLTHDEIGSGVLAAFDRPRPRTVVGVIEPWHLRPG